VPATDEASTMPARPASDQLDLARQIDCPVGAPYERMSVQSISWAELASILLVHSANLVVGTNATLAVGKGWVTLTALPATKSTRGRPRDGELAPRVYRATLDLYGEVGWAGFSLDLVARRARVGKAALYSRWGTKETLIVDALKHGLRPPAEPADTGSIRSDLRALARDVLDSYARADGLVILRAQIEAKIHPDQLGHAIEEWQHRELAGFRPMLVRAIERGELPDGTSLAFVLDTLIGTLINHFLWTPAARRDALTSRENPYVESLLDFVLEGAGYRAVPGVSAGC
jgi:AcrR family transcriptional regulator